MFVIFSHEACVYAPENEPKKGWSVQQWSVMQILYWFQNHFMVYGH